MDEQASGFTGSRFIRRIFDVSHRYRINDTVGLNKCSLYTAPSRESKWMSTYSNNVFKAGVLIVVGCLIQNVKNARCPAVTGG